MARHKQLDSPRKNRFIGYIQAGNSVRTAAEDFGIPQRTANQLYNKFKETGSTHRRPGSGRPTEMTPRMLRRIRYLLVTNRRMSFEQVGNLMRPKFSASSIRRVAAQFGLYRRKGRVVIFLTPEHKVKRLKWAKEYANWEERDWKHVIWSDEAYVVLGDRKGSIYVTRTKDEEFDDDCVIPKFKQSSLRIMVWGCMMKGKRGPLVVLEYPGGKGGGMTAARYREQVLEGVLLEFWQNMSNERGEVFFQQDGASSHTAKVTKAWFESHRIKVFPHPASSPDLNPIEHLWHLLKEIIRGLERAPTTIDELKEAVRQAWDQITVEDVDKYAGSMEDRVQAVIAAKGGHTRF